MRKNEDDEEEWMKMKMPRVCTLRTKPGSDAMPPPAPRIPLCYA